MLRITCKIFFFISFLIAMTVMIHHGFAQPDTSMRPTGYHLSVKGPIGPAVTDYITRTLDKAAEDKAEIALIEMHTPGGLVTAMQDIIQKIIASPVPVVTYVSPQGSHAASAGTYIMYASHIAAMAPATNLGAATPVQMGGEKSPGPQAREKDNDAKPDTQAAMELKSTNDAVAYIRGLAELRGRNADWAEKAVRDAASLSARDALEYNVIDYVSPTKSDLMAQIDGQTVTVNGAPVTLNTANILMVDAAPDWRSKILMIITDPNIAFFLMTIGFYGLIYEFANPGALVPGIIGFISLSVGLFALNILPVNYVGLLLLFLGIGLMSAEAFVPSFGILGIAGAIAFALGGTFLIDTDILGFGVSWEVIAFTTVITVLVVSVLLTMVVRAQRRKVTTGEEALIGHEARVMEWRADKGAVWIWSESWTAWSDENLNLAKGDTVYVIQKKGLRLKISVTPPKPDKES